MKKTRYLFTIILIMLCIAFASHSFANSMIVSIEIYEIKIDVGDLGSYLVDGVRYTESKSFFVRKGGSVKVTIEPKNDSAYLKEISYRTDNVVVINGNEITISDIKSGVEIFCKFISNASSPGKEDYWDGSFTHDCPIEHYVDVNTKEWYHEDLDYVVGKGLMNGVSAKEFEPHEPTTRAMVVTVLHRLEKKPKSNIKNIFDDVEKDTWYTDAVIWANSEGIVLGYGDDTFRPDNSITREEMVAMLYRYNEYKKHSTKTKFPNKILEFSDHVEVSDWAYNAMKWACGEGIINGSDGLILPQAYTERCQMAAILHRFIKKY